MMLMMKNIDKSKGECNFWSFIADFLFVKKYYELLHGGDLN